MNNLIYVKYDTDYFTRISQEGELYALNRDQLELITSILGCIISLFFLSLLIIPGMPGYLGIQSRYCLLIWAILGLIFYIMRRKDYIKNNNND